MANIRVRAGSQNALKVIPFFSGSGVETLLSGSDDVSISGGLLNGMTLVYNSSTSKWEATLDLTSDNAQNLDIDGGIF
jgi:hypothetical protein